MKLTPAGTRTKTGTLEFRFELWPSCPSELRPQAYGLPSEPIANECYWPAATDVNDTPAGMLTTVGTLEFEVVLIPSWPWTLLPQA